MQEGLAGWQAAVQGGVETLPKTLSSLYTQMAVLIQSLSMKVSRSSWSGCRPLWPEMSWVIQPGLKSQSNCLCLV